MGALQDLYAEQGPSHEWYRAEQHSLYEEADRRGLSVGEVASERYEAIRASRRAEAERVAAIVNDPVLLRLLRAYWAPREIRPDGSVAPRPPNPLTLVAAR